MRSLDRRNGELHSSVDESNSLSVELVVDVLSGCAGSCSGCFVSRKTKPCGDDLAKLVALTDEMQAAGMHCEELVLGPTDFFSALNTVEIMADPNMRKLMQVYSFSINTSLEDMSVERIDSLLDALPRPLDCQVQVIVDLNRLPQDCLYFGTFLGRTGALKDAGLDLSFGINYSEVNASTRGYPCMGIYSADGAIELFKDLADYDGEVQFKLVPSFLNSKKMTAKLYAEYKTYFEERFTNTNHPNHSESVNNGNRITLAYRDGNLYVAPYLTEVLVIQQDRFKVNGFKLADVQAKLLELQTTQWSDLPADCQTCEWQSRCINRSVVALRQEYEIPTCPVPFGGQ